MAHDPRQQAIHEHKRWIGYLQPEGLVVSPAALVDFGAQLDASTLTELHGRYSEAIQVHPDTGAPFIESFPMFARAFLGWKDHLLDLYPVEASVPNALLASTVERGEILRPDAAYRFLTPADPNRPWMLLVRQLPKEADLDRLPDDKAAATWVASPTQKFERLLRATEIPIGILCNGHQVRLVYAPKGQNSGNLTFPVKFMTEPAGRAVVAALDMLLSHRRLIAVQEPARLPALLRKSREYQSNVSTQLAEQVLESLYELLRGLQAADQQVGGKLLRDVIARNPDEIYHGLLNVLLRLVFLLFAEDRGLMPTGPLYQRNYSVHGLFERLRAAHERFQDTMDSRYGAWGQLLTLFRLVHEGCKHPDMKTPGRRGNLFDYDRFPFLEGRPNARTTIPDAQIPLVSDGVIYRVLEKLLLLDGERLSYRTLDVEEIGSVYQTIMGFRVEVATGTAIGLKGKRKGGGVPAAPIVYLEQLLATPGKDRNKWLKENADQELTGEADKALKTASSVNDLLAALTKKIDLQATPSPVSKGGLVLQPTDERRRSGSHYTPRSFTRPIVQKTLEPILTQLGRHPKPEELLGLKICDIAVGSAAFLVETCRQLADELIAAWHFHKCLPVIPPDEDEVLHAMRTIAQRCLYGVDRNPMAVDLAKLSLWLATLAKDHPFTFLDHAIRCGDSLVGLTRRQIETFTWKTGFTTGQLWEQEVRKRTAAALRERQNLLGLGDDYGTPQLKREKLEKADELLDLVRFIGDAAVAAFFAADKDKAREAKRAELAERIADYLGQGDLKQRPTDEVKALRGGQFPVTPFHWEIEYPEVFDRENPGFDGIVGNPPFMGGTKISTACGEAYRDWILNFHKESHGNADLVAHFFRRDFDLLRSDGCLGLIATKTIGQGDTRSTGLRWICMNGGVIYCARKRVNWPGQAAVVVSVVHVIKGTLPPPFDLDGRDVPIVTAYLFHAGVHEDAAVLQANQGVAFNGMKIYGQGFSFDDTDPSANPLDTMRWLVKTNPQVSDRIFPYIGGEEVNESPSQMKDRYVMNFGEWPLRREETQQSWARATPEQKDQWLRRGIVPLDYSEPVAADYPDLLRIVEEKVRPERMKLRDNADGGRLKEKWWQFARTRPELQRAVGKKNRVLACSAISKFFAFAWYPANCVFSHNVIVFAVERDHYSTVLQSRVHDVFAASVSSTLGDTLGYRPSDCFETFPFPAGFETNAALEAAGREYYEFRAALMQDLWLGLTEIYNHFHSPDDEALARLEALYRKRAATNDWRTAESVPADRSPLTLYATPAAALAGVRRLRTLHAAMDTAVLTAYGWTDLLPKCTCEFLLDYEDDDSESAAEESSGRKKKKPWRYRWPDEVRDEVLARLLKLNAERAEEERIAGQAAAAAAPTKPKNTKRASKPYSDNLDLNLS